MTAPERKCDDCGLPISICNARAMVGVAVKRNGAAEVAKHMGLPPTLEHAKALPEIRALVEAAKGLLFAHDHGNGLEGWHNTRERLRAALRAIGEGGE